jgi:Holliday junction resolvase
MEIAWGLGPGSIMDAAEKALTRILYDLYRERGGKVDHETLASRLRRYEIGIPAEEEFAVLLSWLGRCRLVHKLDQSHPPTKDYKVPDLLAIFEHGGRPIPVAIEVKATDSDRLSWTPEYLGGLQRYGHEVGVPVLLAWKRRHVDLWALCELRHFHQPVTNYKFTFLEALKLSLMSELAGATRTPSSRA